VLLFNEVIKGQSYWIDIRNHYKREQNDSCILTKFGVCITPNELDQLPNIMKLNEYSVDENKRTLLFKNSDIEFIYELALPEFDGKESLGKDYP